MRIAFMGTPDFSVPVLSELIAAGHEIVAVYTQPARPAGRGKKLRPSPVETLARNYGLNVYTPVNFKNSDDIKAFRDLNLDVAVVVAYGLILPQAILDAPDYGCLNLHGSLLPRWRGAAPIHRAIMAGDQETGVQVMQMEAGLDTGAVLLSETVAIQDDETTGTLHDKLSLIGAQLMPRALAALDRGSLVATPQEEEGVCYAHKITSEEARIDWQNSAHEIDCHIRGLSPFPGAWFMMKDKKGDPMRVKVLMSSYDRLNNLDKQDLADKAFGTVLDVEEDIVVATGSGYVRLSTLQRPGKSAQPAQEFLRGLPMDSLLGVIFE